MKFGRPGAWSVLPVTATLAVAAGFFGVPARAGAASGPHYQVTIQRTAHGIPHITAGDFGSLGYGFGYAFAQDNLCTMANDYVTVEAQRSRYFGPNATYSVVANGTTLSNIDSDIFWQDVADSGVVNRLATRTTGPGALTPAVHQLVQGYVDGYNRYLSNVGGSAGVPDPTCRGQAWVRPITVMDAYLRFYQLVELASQDVAIQGIAEATPPVAGALPTGGGLPTTAQLALLGARLHDSGAGSNAVAVGSAGTRDHIHGLLLGNPHFPWNGTERFYQAQLTIPGTLNVEGATLFGVPLILIGHTATMAWSHTVSTAYRFTPYQLTLVPGDPTAYLYDGTPVAMTSRPVTVEERTATGTLAPVTRVLYSTMYGPVFNNLVGIPLPWTSSTAFAMRDANADNFRVFNHFLATDRATSAAQELSILKKYEGIPWVNTIVADRSGHALYADIGAIPHVTDAEAQACDTALGAVTFKLDRLPVLDGSRSACQWGTDPDSVEPGLFGGNELPSLMRRDYVTNSNDSYWLSNPKAPLTGFPLIIGDYGTARSLRTRLGLIMTAERIAGTDGLGPPGFTLGGMEKVMFSDRQYGAELVDTALVGMCRSFPGGMAPTSSGTPIAVGDACDVLAKWGRRENLASQGAVLFRDFWERALGLQEGPWAQPFNANNPVNTPAGLNTTDPQVQKAFGDALADLTAAGLPYSVPLGQVQYVVRRGVHIPLPGGPGDPDGEFNAIYQDVVHAPGLDPSIGSSYIQVVTWRTGDPCPVAATILTYSESTNPNSPFYADQTLLFSRRQWVPEYFCAAAVNANTISTTVLHGTSSVPAAQAGLPGVDRGAPPSASSGMGLAVTGADSRLPLAAALLAAVSLLLLRIRRRQRGGSRG
ncbi:MAG: penicillin acylase family protein [Mycobacteriales bacterium]